MSDAMPKLDRAELMKELLAEAERTVNEVADAVVNAAEAAFPPSNQRDDEEKETS